MQTTVTIGNLAQLCTIIVLDLLAFAKINYDLHQKNTLVGVRRKNQTGLSSDAYKTNACMCSNQKVP